MTTYHEFDKHKVDAAIATIKAHGELAHGFAAADAAHPYVGNEVSVFAQCIDVVVAGGKICLKIPIFGNVCLPIPTPFPDGTAASACLSICGSFIPTGVKVTVSIAGHVVLTKVFGKC